MSLLSFAPEETGVGRLCAPGPANCQREIFLIRYEDQDRYDRILYDREQAKEVFASSEAMGWNCYLFELSQRADK